MKYFATFLELFLCVKFHAFYNFKRLDEQFSGAGRQK